MTWLNLDAVFPDRRAVLLASRRQLLTDPRCADYLAGGDPVSFEAMWRLVILAARPALRSFTLLSVGYNAALDAFEVHVAHPSFGPVESGQEAPLLPLVPDRCADGASTGE
jgi:hypothetical protein